MTTCPELLPAAKAALSQPYFFVSSYIDEKPTKLFDFGSKSYL